MRIFGQYIRAGDVIQTNSGEWVIIKIGEPRVVGNQEYVVDCDAVSVSAVKDFSKASLPILVDRPYKVLSRVTEDRVARMKLPPPLTLT